MYYTIEHVEYKIIQLTNEETEPPSYDLPEIGFLVKCGEVQTKSQFS